MQRKLISIIMAGFVLAGCGSKAAAIHPFTGGGARPDESTAPITTPDTMATGPDRSAATVATWDAKWCALQPGDTQDQIRASMGMPDGWGPDHDSWNGFGYELEANYNPQYVATVLFNTGDTALKGCAYTRKLPS